MATILSTARALGEYRYLQEEVEPWVAGWLRESPVDPLSALRMCRNAKVGMRSSVVPIEEVFQPGSLDERNDLYEEKAIDLGRRVSGCAIEGAGLRPRDVDLIIAVSCTGFMIPSLDAYLINDLGMRADTKRLPITEMGCAAGAVALSRAREYLRAFPGHRVLVLSVELPTLTFQPDDFSMDNIVSLAIFGDGAAAAVLGGVPVASRPAIADSGTVTLPCSTHLMGFRLGERGFRIILSREIPSAVRSRLRPLVKEFLGRNGLGLGDIRHLVFHPGGKRILEIYREELDVSEDALMFSRKVLRECGNVSSSTVLMILDEVLRSGEPQAGDKGLVMALGPGFSVEQLLLKWEE